MAFPVAPEAVSSLAQLIARHIGPLEQVPSQHLPAWLPDLAVPSGWVTAAIDHTPVTRLLLRRVRGGPGWDGCEVLNLYRVPAVVPEALVLRNADRTLRDAGAADIRSTVLDIAPHYGVIATQATGVISGRDRSVRNVFRHYVINTASDGAALIEQAITVDENAEPVLRTEAEQLTDNVRDALLVSIDRMAGAGGSRR